MPAMIDDPAAAPVRRWLPSPAPGAVPPPPLDPVAVTLRDGAAATIFPFASQHQLPPSLLRHLAALFNDEIEAGDTYPMVDPFPPDRFGSYWIQDFAAVMVLGAHAGLVESAPAAGQREAVDDEGQDAAATAGAQADWSTACLGSYYIKPNYPGRSSHVCNAGFLVAPAARGRGVGRLLAESYLDWAPRLGYEYSVFNLVYETNVASCRIWDALGFDRIGRVPGCGRLKSHPGRRVDAIIYGRPLRVRAEGGGAVEGPEAAVEERGAFATAA